MSDTWLEKTPIAHRGLFEKGVPENSLASIRAAVKRGYAVELDVRMALSGELVLSHDPSTGRVAEKDLTIRTTRYIELKEIKFKDSKEAIPTLDEALKTIGGKVPVLIELKTDPRTKVVCGEVKRNLSNYSGEVAISSFDPRMVRWLYKNLPKIERGQIASTLPEKKLPRFVRLLALTMPLNWWAKPTFIEFDVRDYPSKIINFWHRRLKVPFILWPVRSERELAKARQMEANLIFDTVRP